MDIILRKQKCTHSGWQLEYLVCMWRDGFTFPWFPPLWGLSPTATHSHLSIPARLTPAIYISVMHTHTHTHADRNVFAYTALSSSTYITHMNTHKPQTRQASIWGSLIHQPDQLETYLIRGFKECVCVCVCVKACFCAPLTPLQVELCTFTHLLLQRQVARWAFKMCKQNTHTHTHTHTHKHTKAFTPPVQMCSH